MKLLITFAYMVALAAGDLAKDASKAAGDAVHSTVNGVKNTADDVSKTASQAADCSKKGGIMGAAGCVAGGAAKDTAHAATNTVKTDAHQASVAGHMSLKVAKKVTRRLQGARSPQSATGFAEDANARQALKETVATVANVTANNVKVHTQLSPVRRLAADNVTEDIGVAYMVEAQNGSDATEIHALLSGRSLSAIEALLDERLLEDGDAVYSVELTKHLANLDTKFAFDSFVDDDSHPVQPALTMDGVGSGLAGKDLVNAQSMDSHYPVLTFVGWGLAIGGLAGAVVVALGKTKKKKAADAETEDLLEK